MKLKNVKKSYRNLMLLFSILASFGLSGCGINKKNQDNTKFISVDTLLETIENPELTVLDEMFDEKKCEDLNKVKRYLNYAEKLNSIANLCLDAKKYQASDGSENYAYYYEQPNMYIGKRTDGREFNNYNERIGQFSEKDICDFLEFAEKKVALVNDSKTGYGKEDLKEVLVNNDIYLAIGACNDFLADKGREIVIDAIDTLAASAVVDNTNVELEDLSDFEITADDFSPGYNNDYSEENTKSGEVDMHRLLSSKMMPKSMYLENAGGWEVANYSHYPEYNEDLNKTLSAISQEMSNHINDINSNQNKTR